MKADNPEFTLATLISLSLLLLRCETRRDSKQFPPSVYETEYTNSTSVCHDGFVSVYVSKLKFADLPANIYVHDEHSGYYQVTAVAKQCHYFLEETDTFTILTVTSYGCFVKRQVRVKKYVTSLTVVILAPAERGGVKVVKSIPVTCERNVEEVNKNVHPLVSRHFCSKEGFNITIRQSATVPPLDLDAVWIPSNQSQNCKAKHRSKDAVSFSFPFTDCGTRSTIVDGIITYRVDITVKPQPQKSFIFRHIPLHLTVRCSFALTQTTQVDFEVQGPKSEVLPTLKSEGILRTEMRFAKDASYKSFYSPNDPPTVTELGQPVYVEVFVLKQEDKDLVLLLDDCWAAPTKNPHDPQRWNLLVKGCPFSGDNQKTIVLPAVSPELKYPSLYKRFVVKLFSFVKPQTSDNLVYFHCNIEICKGSDCLQSCSNGGRKLRRIASEHRQSFLYSVVSGEPLLFL